MTDLEFFDVLITDELIDRAWDTFLAETEPTFGDDELGAASVSMARHAFRAGWLSCLRQQLMATERAP